MKPDDAPSRLLRIAAPALVAALLVAAWQGLVTWYAVPAYIIPSPSTVLRALIADRALLLDSLGVTLGIALVALTIATLAGTLIALIFARLLTRDSPRLLLVVGLVAGIGLLTKLTMLFFGLALALALLVTPERRWLRTPWPWLNAVGRRP